MKIQRFDLRTVFLLLALGLVFPVKAEQTNSAAAATKHSLWKVQGKSNAVYLLGSVHILKKEDYPLPAVMESAFTNARAAAFETDIEALENPMTALKLLSKAKLPEGETLQTQLSPEVYSNFTNHLATARMPAVMFNQFTPVMAATTLVVLQLQKLGFDENYGLDKYFFPRAKKAGKRIVALETVDFQLGLISDVSKEEGELLMKTTLRDIDKLENDFGDLLKAWRTGDAEKLDNLLNEATREAPAIFKRWLVDRSKSWIPKIEEMLRGDKDGIVIVGAGHLVGKEGVVELLRKKGFKVTQE